jgi:hypothetical protein
MIEEFVILAEISPSRTEIKYISRLLNLPEIWRAVLF